jgi:hypothetical protein
MRLRYISDKLTDSRFIDEKKRKRDLQVRGPRGPGQIRTTKGNVRVCNSVSPGITPGLRACVFFGGERMSDNEL